MLKLDTPILLLSAIPEEFIAIEKHLKTIKENKLWHGFPCTEGTLFGKKVVTITF